MRIRSGNPTFTNEGTGFPYLAPTLARVVLLSVAFTNHYDSVATYLFGAMLVLALLLPVYRAECVLGFVLG
jgi:hypothetical protein